MTTHSICFAGLSREEEAEITTQFRQANAQLGNAWTLAPEAEAAVVVIDMDSMYGQMSLMKAMSGGKVVVALTAGGRVDTDYKLSRPVTAEGIATLLAELETQAPPVAAEPAPVEAPVEAPVASAPAPAPEPEPAPAPAPAPEPTPEPEPAPAPRAAPPWPCCRRRPDRPHRGRRLGTNRHRRASNSTFRSPARGCWPSQPRLGSALWPARQGHRRGHPRTGPRSTRH